MKWLKKLILRKEVQKIADNYRTTLLGVALSGLLAADADWHMIADAAAGAANGQMPTPEQAQQIGRVAAALIVSMLGYFAADAKGKNVSTDQPNTPHS